MPDSILNTLINIKVLQEFFEKTSLKPCVDQLTDILEPYLNQEHGDIALWQEALALMPVINQAQLDCVDQVKLTGNCLEPDALYLSLKALSPWRKGPFSICNTYIDSEWRSDLKWERIAKNIDLTNKTVLDVGCGNGYYGFRMLGAGAKAVIGIDPSKLFLHQFNVIKQYVPDIPIWQLPLPLEAWPKNNPYFDVTFSMGVLYHRQAPFSHLLDLKNTLKENGQLVLETLIIDGDEQACLVPKDRYAQMRNVWFIPSALMLKNWLLRIGFIDIKLVDISTTSLEEQRTTEWMPYQSLKDFLDQDNQNLTIEGYPAPKRVLIIATNHIKK